MKLLQLLLFRRLYFLLGFLSFSIISCSPKREHESHSAIPEKAILQTPIKSSQIDTSKIVVLAFNQAGNWPFENNYKPVSLSNHELIVIDSLLQLCIKTYNQQLGESEKENYSIDFKKYNYKLQYVAVINNKGEQEVWINGFCDQVRRNEIWKKEIIHVKDGGNCYFNFKINLTTKTCYEISVNGYA